MGVRRRPREYVLRHTDVPVADGRTDVGWPSDLRDRDGLVPIPERLTRACLGTFRSSELLARHWAQLPTGLSAQEAKRRLAVYGPNNAMVRRRRPLWRQILDRLANPLILILLFASGLSAWTGEVTSFVIIVVIILLSVVLDVVQQRRAETTVDALRRSVGLKAQVLRDGVCREVPLDQLVPGDVVNLRAGDIVPGDSRLLSARDCFVNQAMLTGEAYPVKKQAGDLAAPADEVSAASNFLFMGTSVVSGTARAVVCRTGRATELGGLAGESRGRSGRPDAFAMGIRRFGFLMLRLTIFLVLFVLAHQCGVPSAVAGIAAVRAGPRRWPHARAAAHGGHGDSGEWSKSARRRRVIVKRLAAIHDLGAMDVLCTDKTGTLTEAGIRLTGHVDASGEDSNQGVCDLAYLNSLFESGIKSPLDDAILAHEQARRHRLA